MAKLKAKAIPTPTEKEILKNCLALLAARGVFAWRNNVGAFSGTHKGKRRFVRFGMVGAPDVIGLIPGDGRYFGLEVKRPGKFPTPAQVAFLRAVNDMGGVAVWTTSPQQLDAVLDHVLAGGSVRVDEGGSVFLEDPA